MSREGAPSNQPKTTPAAGTPIWVWVVYGLGILAGAIIVLSVLFTLGALLLSDDVPVGFDVSWLAFVVWGGIVVAALATWLLRRRRR